MWLGSCGGLLAATAEAREERPTEWLELRGGVATPTSPEWSVLRGLGLRDTGLAGEPWRKSHGDEQEGDTNRNKKPL